MTTKKEERQKGTRRREDIFESKYSTVITLAY